MANPRIQPINTPLVDNRGMVTPVWRAFFENQCTEGVTGISELTGDVTAGPGTGAQVATIAALAVTTGKIANLAVTTGKIADDAVTYAKMQNVSAASRLLGRGSAAGAGDMQEITPGTGLTMSGTTLNATGGTVTHTGALTANQLVLGNGTDDIKPLGSLGTTTTVYHGNAGGAGSFGAVSLTADVSGILPILNGGTGAAAFLPVHFAFKSNLTNAQFLTLPSTYIELVAAPGANTILVPLWAFIHVDSVAGAYTNVDPYPTGGLSIAYGDWDADAFQMMYFDGASTRYLLYPTAFVPDATILAAEYPDYTGVVALEDKPLKLIAWNPSGDYLSGNAGNAFRIGVAYATVNYVTGVFS